MFSKNDTTYEIFYTTYDKNIHNILKILDNIYEFRRQHMTYFTQLVKKNYATYDNNLYNTSKNYTTYNKL